MDDALTKIIATLIIVIGLPLGFCLLFLYIIGLLLIRQTRHLKEVFYNLWQFFSTILLDVKPCRSPASKPDGKVLTFPERFMWGAATAGYQVEGGIDNANWAKAYPAGIACDHYHRYPEDFDWAQKLGHNAHRFSIEWSRIEPKEGEFKPEALEHYRRVIKALKARGIEPFLTLNHFTIPMWLFEKGGFENQSFMFYFKRYVEYVARNLGEKVTFWVTLNEPIVSIASYLLDSKGRYGQNLFSKALIFRAVRVVRNVAKAHRMAYKVIHQFFPEAQVGLASALPYHEPLDPDSALDRFSVRFINFFMHYFFRPPTGDDQDFIGVCYYWRYRVQFPLLCTWRGKTVPYLGWEPYPEGIYHVLVGLQKYRKPIYVIENGLPDAQDTERIDFIRQHLIWIHRAIQEGADVKGYLHWSLIDNFEWIYGFEPRFGLIEIDYRTLERKPRPSAYFFAKICKENRLVL